MIKPSSTNVNSFHCITIATKGSILDTADFSNPPPITILDKIIFNLTQGIVISFNLIAIYGRRYLYGNYEMIFYKIRLLPQSSFVDVAGILDPLLMMAVLFIEAALYGYN